MSQTIDMSFKKHLEDSRRRVVRYQTALSVAEEIGFASLPGAHEQISIRLATAQTDLIALLEKIASEMLEKRSIREV